MVDSWRLPAEWEPQSAILLAWPHTGTDWSPRLSTVESTYVVLIEAVLRFQGCVLCVADQLVAARARTLLDAAGVASSRLHWVEVPYHDTWLRDSGPIVQVDANRVGSNRFRVLDFRFTGWGGKFDARIDDALVQRCVEFGLFRNATHQRIDFALEGGAIDCDGDGTLLTTWHCMHERHPDRSRAEIEQAFRDSLSTSRVHWLEQGYLEGDDTDAHVDTLARFAAPDAIVYQSCDDAADSHFEPLAAMGLELAALRTTNDAPYRLFALPWARPIVDENRRRLAASYANFLIVNGGVLVPTYGDPADVKAVEILTAAFPGRKIVPVPCRELIWQNGSLHCLTMQLPAGVVDV